MRILHLVHQYPPEHVGGVEIYTRQLARRQVESGHQVWVLTPSAVSAATPSVTDEDGVTVWRIPAGGRNRLTIFAHSWRQPALKTALGDALVVARPDVVHIQHLMGWPLSAVQALLAGRAPCVVTLHDYWFPCPNAQLITNYDASLCQGPDPRWGNCGRCALARAGVNGPAWLGHVPAPLLAARFRQTAGILQSAAAVIAPTHFVQQAYSQAGMPTAAYVYIPHGIEVDSAQLADWRATAAPHTDLHLGFVGSIAWQKGVHVLVEAVNQLPPEGVRLSIVGDLTRFPDYARHVMTLARHPGIRFVGPLSRAEVGAFMTQVDVGVLPTLWYEVSPLTIDEWFAAGAPVVASHVGVLPEKIAAGVNGLLTPPGDATALASALWRLLDEPDLRQRLAAGIGPVRSMRDHAAEIEALYRQLVPGM